MTRSPAFPELVGLLFDKDGTLIDFHASWEPINRRAAAMAAGGDRALARRLLEVGGADPESGRVAADSLLAAAGTSEIAAAWSGAGAIHDAARLTVELDRLFRAAATDVVPVGDLAALFARLRRAGFALGIASSDNEGSIRAMADRFGLSPHLAFVAGYDSGHGLKPEPGMVQAFARAIDAPAARLAMIGDNRHDLAMGRAAGVGLTVGVLTGTGTRETLGPLADHVLSSVDELPALLALSG